MTPLLPVWLLVTPVLYPLSSVPEGLRAWRLNPVTPLVETFRWGTLGVGAFDPREFGFSIAVTVVLLLCGLVYFARADASSAESR